MKTIENIFWVIAFSLITLPTYVYGAWDSQIYSNGDIARGGCGSSANPSEFANPLKFCSIQELAEGILKAIIAIGTPIIILAIVYSGFLFIIARGNQETLKKAKTNIIWVLIGTALVLGALALQTMISGTISQISG